MVVVEAVGGALASDGPRGPSVNTRGHARGCATDQPNSEQLDSRKEFSFFVMQDRVIEQGCIDTPVRSSVPPGLS